MPGKNKAGCSCCGGSSPTFSCCNTEPYVLRYPTISDVNGNPPDTFITNLTADLGSFWGTFTQNSTAVTVGFGCRWIVTGDLAGGSNGPVSDTTGSLAWSGVDGGWIFTILGQGHSTGGLGHSGYSGAMTLKRLGSTTGSVDITGSEQCFFCCTSSAYAFRVARDLISDVTVNVRELGVATYELVYHDEVSTNSILAPCECQIELWDNTTNQSAGTWDCEYNGTDERWELTGDLPDSGPTVTFIADDSSGPGGGDIAPGSSGDFTWGNPADGTAEVTGAFFLDCP